MTSSETTKPGPRISGVGRVLVAVYGILALAATGRSIVQIFTKFIEAPFAYSLSAIAAVVYLAATVSLIFYGPISRRFAWAAILFELAGVVVIGTLSFVMPGLFPHDTVWSRYGLGYLLIPAVLPILGIWWLLSQDNEIKPSSTDRLGGAT